MGMVGMSCSPVSLFSIAIRGWLLSFLLNQSTTCFNTERISKQFEALPMALSAQWCGGQLGHSDGAHWKQVIATTCDLAGSHKTLRKSKAWMLKRVCACPCARPRLSVSYTVTEAPPHRSGNAYKCITLRLIRLVGTCTYRLATLLSLTVTGLFYASENSCFNYQSTSVQ